MVRNLIEQDQYIWHCGLNVLYVQGEEMYNATTRRCKLKKKASPA